jgi:hypothetical protein
MISFCSFKIHARVGCKIGLVVSNLADDLSKDLNKDLLLLFVLCDAGMKLNNKI